MLTTTEKTNDPSGQENDSQTQANAKHVGEGVAQGAVCASDADPSRELRFPSICWENGQIVLKLDDFDNWHILTMRDVRKLLKSSSNFLTNNNVAFLECSGNPDCCPENEGHGCCVVDQTYAKAPTPSMIEDVLDHLITEIHSTAREKGWWEHDRSDGECIVLMHAELSEAVEFLREGNPPDDKIPQFSGAEAELADTIIRILDLAGARGWNVAGAMVAKMEFNKTRPHKHGGKEW